MFYTSLPVVVLGVCDKDVDAVSSVRYSKLYTPGIRDGFFNRKVFAMEAVKGLYSSLMLMGLPAGTLFQYYIYDTITILKCFFSVNFSPFSNSFTIFVSDTDLSWSCQHFYTLCSRLNFGPKS